MRILLHETISTVDAWYTLPSIALTIAYIHIDLDVLSYLCMLKLLNGVPAASLH